MSQLVDLALQRVKAAYSTVPIALEPTAWLYIGAFAALAVPIGMYSGILKFKVEKRPSKWLEVLLVVFLSRGLLEELVFRVMALPHPAVDGPTPPAEFAFKAAISTTVFVTGHLLIPGERQQKTFRDPGFLMMCGIFGAMCSAVYYLTSSLLVIWLVHGVPVAVWLLLLGGVDKVQ
eukprot:GHRQ01005760.1.p1 GENE.GHRQ01005760.1~~GHRQ01005760.1.p1  ORF type:complete len:176 (+),score=65.06 GHRQ01005760.1:268-795(+)